MFDKKWFITHQRFLLFLLNAPLLSLWFRWRLLINGKKSSVGRKKIIRILPNAISWKLDNKLITEFRTHDKFSKRIYYIFLYIWYVFHVWDIVIANSFIPQWNLGFDSTGNLFPAAGANSPMDGYAYRTGVNETFSTIRTSAGNANDGATDGILLARLIASSTSNQYQVLVRSIACFDTSGIGAGNTINSATFSLYGQAAPNAGLGTAVLHVAGATPAATNAIANSDYGQCQTTSFGSYTQAGWSTSGYNDVTLNASGLSNISQNGISKFSLQLDWDINNNFTGAWSSAAQSDLIAFSADQAGTSNDPKLVVVYTLTGASNDYAYFA